LELDAEARDIARNMVGHLGGAVQQSAKVH
jgi:hypothetical protein